MSLFDRILNKLYEWSVDHFVNWRRHLKEYAWAIVIALVLRALVLTIYRIPTGSMIPTFREGDVLIANKFWQGLKVPFTDNLDGWRLPGSFPKPGDVVIFGSAGDEDFYRFSVEARTMEALAALRKINDETSFRHAISVGPAGTNYVFANPPGRTSSLPDPTRISDLAEVWHFWIRASDWPRFQPLLTRTDLFEIRRTQKAKLGVTFAERTPPPLWRSVLETPISGAAALVTVLIDNPFGILPKLAVVAIAESLRKDPPAIPGYFEPGRFGSFSLYPNRWTDSSKDYVKRMIADEGDTVEIKDGIVYVNGVVHAPDPTGWLDESRNRRDGSAMSYKVVTNALTRTSGGKTETVRFPVRQVDGKICQVPDRPFDASLWPYFPHRVSEEALGPQYADNFGPLKVPAGHIFVMGDNRDDSLDARFWGCAPKRAIKATAMVVIFPLSRAGLIR